MRTDRLSLLLAQFDQAHEMARARLEGLGDEEYLWEPTPDAWSVRRRGAAASPNPVGPGEWQLDEDFTDPPGAPVTTIAWRLGHLHWSFAGRWEWTFGERRRRPNELTDYTPSATVALERFWELMDRWRAAVAALTPEQLDTSGFGQFPNGSDPDEPFVAVIWWTNLEYIHHMAEIGLLRDLWRART